MAWPQPQTASAREGGGWFAPHGRASAPTTAEAYHGRSGQVLLQRAVYERDGRAAATILHRVNDRVCQHTFLVVRTSVFRILPSLKWGAVSAQKKKISGPQRVTLNIPECNFLLLSFLSASVQGSMPAVKTFLTPHPTLSCFISVCVFFFLFSLTCREE